MININPQYLLIIYFILINIITYIYFLIDKKRAKKGQWRIPESRLLSLSFIGGSIGGLLGMLSLRHKTKQLKFKFLMPIFLLTNIVTLIMLIK